MKRGIAALFTAIALLASGLSIAAHHSFAAQYDRDKPITLKGGITRIEWANPHIYFYIDVAEIERRPRRIGRSRAARRARCIGPDGEKIPPRSAMSSPSTASSPAMDRSWSTCRRALLADGRNLFVGNQTYYQKGR